MPKPFDAYREGYERGRHDTLGGRLAEATMGMLRDDPGGHFAAGYSDGGAGKKFNPPSEAISKAAPRQKSAGSTATDLEKSWWALCDASVFIPKYIADYYIAALNAQGSQVALVIGLHNFTGQICPHCGAEGQFKIRFLGRLEHPECHWSGYMGTGSYIGFQLSQVLHSSMRVGGQMKEDAKKPDDKGSNWIVGIVGFLMTAVFRLALAVVLVPLHTIVAVFQPGQSGADIAKRVAAMAVFLAVVAFGVYKIQTADRQRFQTQPQPTGFVQPNSPPSHNPTEYNSGPAPATASSTSQLPDSFKRLTTDPSRDFAPVWSYDGRILFQSNRTSNRNNASDIWEMRPDGGGQRELVKVIVSTPPEWGDPGLGGGIEVLGSTGDLAVYEAQHFHEIMRVGLSRATAFPIIRTVQDGDDAYFTQLLQIPGGQSASGIVYCQSTGMAAWVANVSGQSIQIRVANLASMRGQSSADFGTPIASVSVGGSVQGMSYSPDGTRLVAAICSQSCGSGRGADLYILDTGTGQILRQLTNSGQSGVNNSSPKWSPTGDWIAFTGTAGGQDRLWLVSPNTGSSPVPVDTGAMASSAPSWSKDGSALAFVGVTDGNQDIWLAPDVTRRSTVPSAAAVQPTFNCALAKTLTEKLICRDADLASLERGMVAAYRQVDEHTAADQRATFHREHREWFKVYARACNTELDDGLRKACIERYLSNRKFELEARAAR